MTQTKLFLYTFFSLCLIGLLVHFLFFRTPSKPWEESGHLVLAFRTAPGPQGKTETVTFLSRRITLKPGSNTVELILDTDVPTGTYTGFAFTLKSPELRNNWEEETAPEAVTLGGNSIQLSVPYDIQTDVTSAVILAFETQNVIKNVEEKHILLPVIQIETRSNANVTTLTENTVEIKNGTILHSATFGMDWDGAMRHNFRAKNKPANENTKTIPVTESYPAQTTTTAEENEDLQLKETIATSSDSIIYTKATSTNTASSIEIITQ